MSALQGTNNNRGSDVVLTLAERPGGDLLVTTCDGGILEFHGEKGTTWEGGMRVPMIVRWPGVIEPWSAA